MLGPLQVKGPSGGAVVVTDNNGNPVVVFDDPITLVVVTSSIVTLPNPASPDEFSYRTVWVAPGVYRLTISGSSPTVYVDSYVKVNPVTILDPTNPYFGFKSGDNITPFVNALKAMAYQGLNTDGTGAVNTFAGPGPVMYIPSVSNYASPWLCDQVIDLPDNLVIRGQNKQMSVVQATSGCIEALWSFQATTFRTKESTKNIIQYINVQGNNVGMLVGNTSRITYGSNVVSNLPTSWFTAAVDQYGLVGVGDILEGWGLPPLTYLVDVPVTAGGSQPPGQVLISVNAVNSNFATGLGVAQPGVIRRKGWRVNCNVVSGSNILTTTSSIPWAVRGLRVDSSNAGADRRVTNISVSGGVTTITLDAPAPGNTVSEIVQFHIEPRGIYMLNANTSPFALLPGANTQKGARSCYIYDSIFDAFGGTGFDSEPGRDQVHSDNCVGNSNGRYGVKLQGVNDVKCTRPGFNGNWDSNVVLQGAATYKLIGPGDVSDSSNNFIDLTTGLHNSPEIVCKGGQQMIVENIDNNGILFGSGGSDQYVPGSPSTPIVYKIQLNNYNAKLNPGNRNTNNGGQSVGGYGPKAAIVLKNMNAQGSGVDPYALVNTAGNSNANLQFDYFVQFLDSDSIATFSNIQFPTEVGSAANPFAIGLTNSTTGQLRLTYDDLTTGEQAETAQKRFDGFVSLGSGLAFSAASQIEISPVNSGASPITPAQTFVHVNKTGSSNGSIVALYKFNLWDLPYDGQTHIVSSITGITGLGWGIANNGSYTGTSATSLTVGAMILMTIEVITSNKPYAPGQRILLISTSSGATITGIVQTTTSPGTITFLADGYSGTPGTYNDWTLSIQVPWSLNTIVPATLPPGSVLGLTYDKYATSPGWRVWLNTTAENTFPGARTVQGSISSGGAFTIVNSNRYVLMQRASGGSTASFTFKIPSTPVDGQVHKIAVQTSINSITWALDTNVAVTWATNVAPLVPTYLVAGSTVEIEYTAGGPNPGWYITEVVSPGGSYGTFTPTISPATLGDWAVTYGVQYGFWQISNGVGFVRIGLTFTPAFTTAAGTLTITGNPVIPNSNFPTPSILGLLESASWVWVSNYSQTNGQITNTGGITIIQTGPNKNLARLTTSGLTSGASHAIELSGSYQV